MTMHLKKFGSSTQLHIGACCIHLNEACLDSTTGAELFYLDRAVVEAQLGSLQELNEIRRREAEKRGLVKSITFAELQEIGLLGTGYYQPTLQSSSKLSAK